MILRQETEYAATVSGIPDAPADLSIRASITAPGAKGDHAPMALICWPGGCYGRQYWDLQIPGRTDYSFAEYMAAAGFIVVAADPLGVGESGRPADGSLCTLACQAEAAADFAREITRRITAGTLIDGLPPLPSCPLIGVGHSMGALLVVLEQVLFDSYTAVAALGFRFLSTVRESLGLEGRKPDDQEARAAAVAHVRSFFGSEWSGEGMYGVIDKAPAQVDLLNGPDVPQDVVAFDNANSVAWPAASTIDAFILGRAEDYARRLRAPSFLGFGEMELPGPATAHDHVPYFSSVEDLTLYVLPQTYHCHNFQNRRFEMWRRLATWLGTIESGLMPAARQR